METTKVIRSAAVSGARRLPVGRKEPEAKSAPSSKPGASPLPRGEDSRAENVMVAHASALTYQTDLVDSLTSQVQSLEKRIEELTLELHQSNAALIEYRNSVEEKEREGFQQGYREGADAAKNEGKKNLAEMAEALEHCKRWVTAEVEGLEFVAKDIVLAALVKIVGHEYQNPAFVAAAIKQVALQVRDSARMTIRVNKRDYDALHNYLPSLQEKFGEQIQIQTDTRIQTGGCLIETDTGTFDGRLETQIKLLQESLEAVVNGKAGQA